MVNILWSAELNDLTNLPIKVTSTGSLHSTPWVSNLLSLSLIFTSLIICQSLKLIPSCTSLNYCCLNWRVIWAGEKSVALTAQKVLQNFEILCVWRKKCKSAYFFLSYCTSEGINASSFLCIQMCRKGEGYSKIVELPHVLLLLYLDSEISLTETSYLSVSPQALCVDTKQKEAQGKVLLN